ncbi:hypothetical protein DFQ30_008806 [Apophysomyces sp. BC1015]|nr:hypothetical protein DFQ30_008806 [Apophysomyces sp. BC1015]
MSYCGGGDVVWSGGDNKKGDEDDEEVVEEDAEETDDARFIRPTEDGSKGLGFGRVIGWKLQSLTG